MPPIADFITPLMAGLPPPPYADASLMPLGC